jgi:hypothetical protein
MAVGGYDEKALRAQRGGRGGGETEDEELEEVRNARRARNCRIACLLVLVIAAGIALALVFVERARKKHHEVTPVSTLSVANYTTALQLALQFFDVQKCAFVASELLPVCVSFASASKTELEPQSCHRSCILGMLLLVLLLPSSFFACLFVECDEASVFASLRD